MRSRRFITAATRLVASGRPASWMVAVACALWSPVVCAADRWEQPAERMAAATEGSPDGFVTRPGFQVERLFVVPKDQFQTHLRTLAGIAKFLNDRAVRERLGTVGTAEEILEIFRS